MRQFLRRPDTHHGDSHGDKLASTMVLSGELLCVYLYPPQEEQVTKERSRGVQGGLYAPILIDADAEIEG